MFGEFGINAGFVEDLHARYRQSPQSVDAEWREVFESLDRGEAPAAPQQARTNGNGAAHAYTNGAAGLATPSRDERLLAAAAMQGRVYQLVNAYRVRGHLFARIDPLGTAPEAAPELELSNFG